MGDEIWWKSMWNATYITLIALTFQNVLAFALALACDREMRLKGVLSCRLFHPPRSFRDRRRPHLALDPQFRGAGPSAHRSVELFSG